MFTGNDLGEPVKDVVYFACDVGYAGVYHVVGTTAGEVWGILGDDVWNVVGGASDVDDALVVWAWALEDS